MDKRKFIKIAGIAATIIGGVTTLVSEWVKERELNNKIDEKINKAFENREES